MPNYKNNFIICHTVSKLLNTYYEYIGLDVAQGMRASSAAKVPNFNQCVSLAVKF